MTGASLWLYVTWKSCLILLGWCAFVNDGEREFLQHDRHAWHHALL